MNDQPSRPHEDAATGAERQLVERARTDADAFAELYRRYLPRVHAFAWRRTGNRQAAEDICSATFEAVLTNLDGFEWRRGGFAPWIFRIAANQTITHHRREGRAMTSRGQQAMATLEPGRTAATDPQDRVPALVDEADAGVLREAIGRLPERYERAIVLGHLSGLGPAEAAQAMGLAKPAFAVVLSRARKALRRELDRPHRGGTT